MKETYRRIGLLLVIIYTMTYLLDLVGVLIGDDSVVYTLVDKAVLLYALILLGFVLIPYKNLTFQLTRTVITIPVKRICMFYQFIGLIISASLLIIYRKETPFLLTVILITGLMGVKYHIMHYRGVLLLALYYLVILAVESFITGLNIHVLKMFVNSMLFFLVLFTLFQDELRAQFDLMKKYREQTVRMRKRLRNYESSQLDPTSFGLTQREMEVLELLCTTSSSNQELANELGIKIHTVKTHLRNIFDKAGVDDRHQLIDLCKSYFISDQDADRRQAVRMPR
jgi:DNA-binding CsgD family transcriptional regulator